MDRNVTNHLDRFLSFVATREGGVDRNETEIDGNELGGAVATREGGVDRNLIHPLARLGREVATREGGVDRNL